VTGGLVQPAARRGLFLDAEERAVAHHDGGDGDGRGGREAPRRSTASAAGLGEDGVSNDDWGCMWPIPLVRRLGRSRRSVGWPVAVGRGGVYRRPGFGGGGRG
jgi:hypothetical protein